MRLPALTAALLLAGCTLPLQQDPAGPAATLLVRNVGDGYSQAMTFTDAQTCAEPHLLGYAMRPGASGSYKVPAARVITVSIGAFGVRPDEVNMVAVCRPTFLSVKLTPGHAYELAFAADGHGKTCTARLTETATGTLVTSILRQGKGGQVSGALATTPSCTPDPAIDAL
jgi:hypothetical protein